MTNCESCGKEIKSEKVVDYSKEKLGRVLCFNCQKAHKEGVKAPEKKVASKVQNGSREYVSVRQTAVNASSNIIAAMIKAGSVEVADVKESTKALASELETWISR